jgi:hypothetical protein
MVDWQFWGKERQREYLFANAANGKGLAIDMKKVIIASAAVLMLILFTACRPDDPEPPYGVWVSEEPRIVLYVQPEYLVPTFNLTFIGRYEIDGYDRKIFLSFHRVSRMVLYEGLRFLEGGAGSGLNFFGTILVGDFRVIGDEMHYTLTPYFQEQMRVRTIIFRRIDDYDPIDPYDWFYRVFPQADEAAF